MVLEGKTALVTGASRGIGRAIAIKLASLGANVVINFTNNSSAAAEVVDEIVKMGKKALAVQCDVGKAEDVEKMMEQVKDEFGGVDILINNAGITRDNLLMRMKNEDWDDVIMTNLKGAFNCTKAAIRGMMKRRYGKIVNISSVVGITGNAGQSNYAAAKAGLIGFTKSMAKELASRGINVNAIAPGFISTDMTGILSEDIKEKLLTGIPLACFGTAEDVAEAVVFFVSESSRYITGQVLHVDGGMVI